MFDMSNYVPTSWTFCLLRTLNILWATAEATWGFIKRFVSGVIEVLGPQNYVFFKGNPTPYRATVVNEKASGSTPVDWYYNPDKHIFLDPTDALLHHVRPLPILSAEIVLDGRTFYDLTDFAETVRVYSEDERAPSIQHLIGAWGLSSGIVLDHARGFETHVILNNGSAAVLDPNDTDPLGPESSEAKTAAAAAPTEELEEGEIREACENAKED